MIGPNVRVMVFTSLSGPFASIVIRISSEGKASGMEICKIKETFESTLSSSVSNEYPETVISGPVDHVYDPSGEPKEKLESVTLYVAHAV